MAIQGVIERVIRRIPKGQVFDSHFVIEQLLKNYSDEYIRFTSRYSRVKIPTLTAHQQLGRQIDQFDSILIRRLPHTSHSQNMHGRSGQCALWQKL